MPLTPPSGGPTPPPLPQAEPTPVQGQDTITLSWRQPKGLVSLSFVNFFLKIITLGIYAFWARTEVRKRLWSGIRLNGEPLHYTGTGGELFKGFVIIFFVVLIPLLLVSVASALIFGPNTLGHSIVSVVMYVVIFFLFGMGIYRAWRYRLSRTRWRGIRAALIGSDTDYAGRFFWTGLLIPFSLGWIVPWRTTRLQELITNDTLFGSRPFQFTAKSGPLYLPYAVLWFGGIAIAAVLLISFLWPVIVVYFNMHLLSQGANNMLSGSQVFLVLGTLAIAYLLYSILSSWYLARQFNHFANHTHFESGRFQGSMTGLGLMWIAVSNFFIIFLTLGLLTPIAQARMMRYTIEHLSFVGTAPLEAIAQSAQAQPSRGEGLAQAFDIDGF